MRCPYCSTEVVISPRTPDGSLDVTHGTRRNTYTTDVYPEDIPFNSFNPIREWLRTGVHKPGETLLLKPNGLMSSR